MKTSLLALARRSYTWVRGLDSIRLLLLGYTSYIVLGWLLLCLPIAHQASGLKSLDHLFLATSAASTTGLTPAGVKP
jgi:trk system potassium uptake protein TrkH